MAHRPHGHAKVNPKNPSAFGVCDRDGFLYSLDDLVWEYQWMGTQLKTTWFRVCKRCLDVPQDQLRPKNVPADPIPRVQPRPENYAAADAGTANLTAPTFVSD